MKVSNETKVGALTAIAITILILGFNFLKGKDITELSNTVFAEFPSVEGLAPSSPVYVKGYQVGRVADLEAKDANLTGIKVSITLKQSINIPKDSYATLSRTLLGATSVVIVMGNAKEYVQDGGELSVKLSPDLMTQVKTSLDPAVDNINKTLVQLESVIQKLNAVLDPNTQNNLHEIVANLTTSSKSLVDLLNTQSGALAHTLNNVESVTGNLAKNNASIDSTLNNLQVTTKNLSQAKIAETVSGLQSAVAKLETTLNKVNSPEGSVGALLNDRKLYDELRQTNRSLTTLLDDFKTHPKRYVNVSVFGKKDKTGPLSKPLYDSIPAKGSNK